MHETYKCHACGHDFNEQQMANEFFCSDCEKDLQKCPICGTREVFERDDVSMCLKCGSMFNSLIFCELEKPQFYCNELEALCTCGSLQKYHAFEVSDNQMYVVMKCEKCNKTVYNKLNF